MDQRGDPHRRRRRPHRLHLVASAPKAMREPSSRPRRDEGSHTPNCHRGGRTFCAVNTLEIEHRLAQKAASQIGLVTWAQAHTMGVEFNAFQTRLRAGTLHRVHTGVYRLSSVEPSTHQRILAACLAIDGSVICDFAAATIHGLPVGNRYADRRTALIVPHEWGRKSAPDITVRRTRARIHSQPWHGGRVMTPTSTIVSLAGLVPPQRLARCLDHALAHRLVTVQGLSAEVDERMRFVGRPALQRELTDRSSGDVQHRSGTEQRVARWIRASRLPAPKPNLSVKVGGNNSIEVDFGWPKSRVGLEVSPFLTHGSAATQRRDMERRALLQHSGWHIVEATDEHLVDQAHFAPILERVGALIARQPR